MKLTILGYKIDIKVFIGVFIVFIIFFNLIYYINFHGLGISKSTTVWAEYGSYVAGVTSILNLIVFIFLTVYVAQLSDSNSEKQLDIQKKIFIAQFRQTELKIFNDEISKAFKSAESSDWRYYLKSLVILSMRTNSITTLQSNLFPIFLDKEFSELFKKWNEEISYLIETLKKSFATPDILDELDINLITAQAKLNGEIIIRKLQDSIIEDLK